MAEPVLIEEGPKPVVKVLLRFMERRWTEAFRAGRIRMGTVERYRMEYEDQEGGRNDPDEHLHSLYQPEQVEIRAGGRVIGGVEGQVKIRRNFDECSYLLCMSAITDRDINAALGNFRFDKQLLGLGDAAVSITHGVEFTMRMKAGIDKVPWLRSHPGSGGIAAKQVEYVDFSTHHGDVGPFRKSLAFRYQHEWRVALIDSTEGRREDNLTLDIGDISDITEVLDTEKLINLGIQVRPVRSRRRTA